MVGTANRRHGRAGFPRGGRAATGTAEPVAATPNDAWPGRRRSLLRGARRRAVSTTVWIVTGVIVAAVLVSLTLVKGHHRLERKRGRTGWTRSDVIGFLAAVIGVVAIIVPVAIANTATPAPAPGVGQQQPPTPQPQTQPRRPGVGLDESQAARLHEGDVSLFTEILGDPGYRRPVLRYTPGGESEQVEGLSEWGWAHSDQYMVRAAVDDGDQVIAFSVTTLSPTFRPDIPYLSEIAEQPLRLGEATFADLDSAFDAPFTPTLVRGITGALQGRWHYAEVFDTPRPLFRRFVMVHGSTGDLAIGQAAIDQITAVGEHLGECPFDGCPPDAIEAAPLREARAAWAITTVTVYGEDFPDEAEEWTLGAEPLDDDVAEADRN